jgi:hypothetical protein
MAVTSGLAQDLWVQGSKLSGDVGTINNISMPRGEFNITSMDLSAMKRIQGAADGLIDFTPYFNDAAGAAHPILSALPSTDVLMLYSTGQAIGDAALSMVVKQVNYDWTRGQDGELLGSVQGENANGLAPEWMDMLTASSDTQSSSGTTSSIDDASSTANGLAAVLHIESIASGTPTVTIEDSTNNSTWVTLKAFTAVANTTEPIAERVEVTGTVNRYLRLNVSGTFSNMVYSLAYRRGTAEDDVAYA